MNITNTKGNIIGIRNKNSPEKIKLINPDKPIEIKKNLAHNLIFCYFYYIDTNGREINIPMKKIIEDGYEKKGNYIYKGV